MSAILSALKLLPTKLIPTSQLIEIAKSQGIDFGKGNPYERIRYFIKLGLLPKAQKKTFVDDQFKTKIEGHLPVWVLERLYQIHNFSKEGYTILQIKDKVVSGEIKLFTLNQTVTKDTCAPATPLQIPTSALIATAKREGVDFGKGNPYERIRYLIKLGLLPNAEKRVIPQPNSKPKIEGYMPFWSIERLKQIQSLMDTGLTILEIRNKLERAPLQKPTTQTTQETKPICIQKMFLATILLVLTSILSTYSGVQNIKLALNDSEPTYKPTVKKLIFDQDVLQATAQSRFLEVNTDVLINGNIVATAASIGSSESSNIDFSAQGDIEADGTLSVAGATTLSSTLIVSGAATLSSTLVVQGASTLSILTVNGVTTLNDDLTFSATTPTITIDDTETLTINDGTNTLLTLKDSGSTGDLTITGQTTSNGNLTGKGTLNISGASTLSGAVTASSTLKVSGDTTLSGALSVSGSSTLSGAVTASSTLAVSGATTLSSTLAVTGASTFSSALTLSQISAPSTTTDKLYNVGGVLYFNGTNISSDIPIAGTSGQTLYHDGTNWTATSNLYHNGTNVGIGTAAPVNALAVISTTSPQLRIGYDNTTNYLTGSVSSAGAVTFDTNGASAGFAFSDAVTASSTLAVTGITSLNGAINLGSASDDDIAINGKLTTNTVPKVDLGVDLGTSTYRFGTLYVGAVNSNSSLSTLGQALFTYKPTDATLSQSSVEINPSSDAPAAAANGILLGFAIGGYQRAGVDVEGDLNLGFASASDVTAPTSDYPLNIYNHSTTRVSFVDTSGNAYFAGNVGIGTSTPAATLNINSTETTSDAFRVDADSLTTGNALRVQQDSRDMLALSDRDFTVGGHTDLTTLSNITDIYIYDTSKDIDGGRWTDDDRARASSWYNETLSDADRGATRPFPKKAVIVTTAADVRIYDSKDNSLWMQFNQSSDYALEADTNNNPTSVFALNGKVYVGMDSSSATGLYIIDFKTDKITRIDGTDARDFGDQIDGRNADPGTAYADQGRTGMNVANARINDVHAAVVNGKTYAVVATYTSVLDDGAAGTTNGGISILNETDQSVVEITYRYGTGGQVTEKEPLKVFIAPDGTLYALNEYNNGGSNDHSGVKNWGNITSLSAQTWDNATCTQESYPSTTNTATPSCATATPYILSSDSTPTGDLLVTSGTSTIDGKSNTVYVGTDSGMSVIQEKSGDLTNGSAKYYTANYISEEQVGDIRGMWPFNGSGSIANGATVSDISYKGLTMTASNSNGTGFTYATGARGTGITFDGTDDYLTCTDASCGGATKTDISTGQWSIGAWVKTSTTGTRQMILSKGTVADHSWDLEVTSGNKAGFYLYQADGSTYIGAASTKSVTDGAWHHIAGTWNPTGTSLSLYVDGVLEASTTSTTGTLGNDSAADFQIGNRADGGIAFNGTIDEPFVTAETINASQVRNIYNIGKRALQNHDTSNDTDSDGVTDNDTVQKIYGSSSNIRAIAVDESNSYIYIGTNSGSDTGGISVIGTASDTREDVFASDNATTDKDDDDTTDPFTDDDFVAVSVSGKVGPSASRGGRNLGGTIALANSAEFYVESKDASLQDFFANSYNPFGTNLNQSQITVDNIFRVVNQLTSRVDNLALETDTEPFVGESFRINPDGTLLSRSLFNSTTAMQFQNASGTTILDIDSTNSRVGIGTTAPGANLHLANTGSTQLIIDADTDNATETDVPSLLFKQDGGAVTFQIGIEGSAGTTFTNSIANTPYIYNSYSSSGLQLATNGAARVMLDTNGNVGIGTTAPVYQLQLSTDSAGKPTSNTWTIVSDARLKENVAQFTDGLAVIEQINPVSYELNGKAGTPRGAKGIGILAQDVKDIIPYTISTFKARLNPEDSEDTELLSFNSSALTFVTINAIKELNQKVAAVSPLFVEADGTINASLVKAEKLTLSINPNLQATDSNGSLVFVDESSNVTGGETSLALDVAASLQTIDSQLADLESRIRNQESREASQSAQLASTTQEVQSQRSALQILQDNIASISASLATKDTNLDLTPPDTLLATGSAQLADITLSNKLSTLNLEAFDATVSGTFKALADSFLGNTTIAGDLSIDGTLSMTGNSISNLSTLYIQNSPLATLVDFFNGIVQIDNKGIVTLQKLAVSQKSLGSVTIPAGQTAAIVVTDQLTDQSRIFTSVNKAVTVGVKSKDVLGAAFTLELEQAQSSDVTVDWWVVEAR